MVTPAKAPPKAAPRKLPAKAATAPKPTPPVKQPTLTDIEDSDVFKKAQAALAKVGLDLGEVFQELVPIGVNEEDILRLPVRPTLRQVQVDPIAVVMVEWDSIHSDDFGKAIDHDSESFDDLGAAQDYYNVNKDFATRDVEAVPEARHIIVMFEDTTNLFEYSYDVIVADNDQKAADWKKAAEALLDAKEHDFVFWGKTDKLKALRIEKAVEKGEVKVKTMQRSKNAPGQNPPAKRAPIKSSNTDKKPPVKAVKNPPPAKRTAEDIAADLKASRERRGVDRQGRLVQKAAAEAAAPVAKKAPANRPPKAIQAKKATKVNEADVVIVETVPEMVSTD